MGRRKAVVKDVKISTRVKIKKGYGAEGRIRSWGPEGNKTNSLLFTELLPGHHICPRQWFLGLISPLPSLLW